MDRLLHLNIDPIDIKNEFLEEFNHLKGNSFNAVYSTMKTFFDYLILNKLYLDSNPFELVKRKKEAKKLANPFKDSQIEKILNRCPSEHRFMYEVFLNTGVRLDELLNLKFNDFNSKQKILHVRGQTSGGGAKGDKERNIYLTDLLLKKYEAYLVDYRLKKPDVSQYVFVNPQGGQMGRSAVNGRMRKLRLKLRYRIHPHRFRATYATHLHREGKSILIVSLLMGHEKIETTQRYIFVSENELREAQTATWLGKKEEEAKQIEKQDRKIQNLSGMVTELIRKEKMLLEELQRLKD